MSAITILRSMAKIHGLTLIERSNGHVQITGGHLLVNYYPESKRRTAYVGATKAGIHHVSPEKAIAMALTPPPLQKEKVVRRRREFYRKHLNRMFAKDRHCYWCHEEIARPDASVDHRIPLKRGGLDNASNFVLAHKTCNHARGHDMPEVKNRKAAPDDGCLINHCEEIK
jgi:hypothetical protein